MAAEPCLKGLSRKLETESLLYILLRLYSFCTSLLDSLQKSGLAATPACLATSFTQPALYSLLATFPPIHAGKSGCCETKNHERWCI